MRLPIANLGLESREVGRLDVGWVRDDQIPRAIGQSLEQIVACQLDGETRTGDVLRGERERVRRAVEPRDDRTRMLVGNRERDRTGAGADVQHARPVEAGDERESTLDEDLRLRSRDQRPPVDGQREVAESPLAEHVLERLAPCSPGHELPRRSELRLRQRTVERRVELDPLEAQGLREQPFRIEPRCVGSLRGEMLGGEAQDLADGDRVEAGLEPGADAAPATLMRRRPRARAADPPTGSPP